jgi:predicted nuclease with TOPRIM domain
MDLDQLINICRHDRERLKSITKDTIAAVLVNSGTKDDSGKQARWMMELLDEIKEIRRKQDEMQKTNEKLVAAMEKIQQVETELTAVKKENTDLKSR